jgi:hypothetical protein
MQQQYQKYQRHVSTVQITSPPDKALTRPLGFFSNTDRTTYRYFITLQLLEAIKGACRDSSEEG